MNGLWFAYLLAFKRVDTVSNGYKIISPIQLANAEKNATLTLL